MILIAPGATSNSIDIQIVDDDGIPVAGLLAATMPTIYYSREREAAVSISLSDLATITSAFSSGGVKERTGSSGYYRLDLPNAAAATASKITIYGEATGKRVVRVDISCGTGKVPATIATGDIADIPAVRAAKIDNADVPVSTRLASGSYTAPDNAAIAAAVWDRLTSALTTVGSVGKWLIEKLDVAVSTRASQASVDALATENAGTGARTVTATINDGATVLQGARIRYTKGAETRVLTTDVNGHAVFGLDDGTWSVAIALNGYTFTPTTLVVDGDEAPIYSMTQLAIDPPADPELATGYCTTYDAHGAPEPNAKLDFAMVDPFPEADEVKGTAWTQRTFSATSDNDSLLQTTFKRGASYKVRRGVGDWITFTVPDEDSFPLPEVNTSR